MNITQESLANRLLYLPLDLHEKVLLWLTYKGIKPVSEITASRRGNLLSLARRGIKRVSTYSFDSQKSKRIQKWISDAGLYLFVSPEHNSEWHVGRDKDKVKLSSEILRRFDYDNELNSGLLFGFPESSVKAYALNREAKDDQRIPMAGTGDLRFENDYLQDKYFAPYVLYNMPVSSIEIDSQTAKLWADTIRKDVPKLAKWFEDQEMRRRKKQESAHENT